MSDTRTHIGSRTGTSENQTSETTVDSSSYKKRRTTVKVTPSVDNSKRATEKKVLKPEEEAMIEETQIVKVFEQEDDGRETENCVRQEEVREEIVLIENQKLENREEETEKQLDELIIGKEEDVKVMQEEECVNECDEEQEKCVIIEENSIHVALRQYTVSTINDERDSSLEEHQNKAAVSLRARELSYSTNLRPTQTTSLRHLVIFTDPK